MRTVLALLIVAFFLVGCAQTAPSTTNTTAPTPMANPHALLHTSKGDIELELYSDKAPLTVKNFIKLSQQGFYDGVAFHRVIPGFMIQSGDPLSKNYADPAIGTGGPGYTIPDEIVPSLHNVKGVISMANTGQPNTGGSQFFITTADDQFLDGGYTVFGRVLSGQDVADAIAQVPRNAQDKPLTAVVLTSIEIKQ